MANYSLSLTQFLMLGARYDAFAFNEYGLDHYLEKTTLVDKGYVGMGLLTPIKRKHLSDNAQSH